MSSGSSELVVLFFLPLVVAVGFRYFYKGGRGPEGARIIVQQVLDAVISLMLFAILGLTLLAVPQVRIVLRRELREITRPISENLDPAVLRRQFTARELRLMIRSEANALSPDRASTDVGGLADTLVSMLERPVRRDLAIKRELEVERHGGASCAKVVEQISYSMFIFSGDKGAIKLPVRGSMKPIEGVNSDSLWVLNHVTVDGKSIHWREVEKSQGGDGSRNFATEFEVPTGREVRVEVQTTKRVPVDDPWSQVVVIPTYGATVELQYPPEWSAPSLYVFALTSRRVAALEPVTTVAGYCKWVVSDWLLTGHGWMMIGPGSTTRP